ncbi:MAG: alpha/beta fold hydrolase [Bacteroidota bacterium]
MNFYLKEIGLTLLGLGVLVYGLLYFLQERLIFFSEVLPADHQFSFEQYFEEVWLAAEEEVAVHGLLFQKAGAKGIVLFLHGNADSVDSWGSLAPLYLQNGYDVFFLDYRGYGKSQGKIQSEQQLVSDAQLAYDYLAKRYPQTRLVVSATSIGTGIATQLAASNPLALLLLNSPYSSLEDLIREKYPIVPPFVIKYKLATWQYVNQVEAPIVVFHGQKDNLIPPSHAVRLKKQRSDISMHIFPAADHNNLSSDPEYANAIGEVLAGL